MFIEIENTPNPNALKFLVGKSVSSSPIYITSAKSIKSPLAIKLFDVSFVEAVFLGSDFLTITKHGDADWEVIRPQVVAIITDHFVAGLQVIEESCDVMEEYSSADLTEIEKQIIEIIETKVRPSVAMDGGDIVYKGFEKGVVLLQLRGACSGCPSAAVTLKQGVESMLKYYVPEVVSVEAVDS
ncbi:MAG: NifU family protein [Rickettsiaceae bacterium]|nr:NifU family protein [Rickettsiaceae bacterium]